MTHFARKLRYAAHDGDDGSTFAALIELAFKKGGPSTGFVLFWRVLRSPPMRCKSKMIRLEAKTAEEAIVEFWLSGKKFPGWQSEKWEKTTPWLDRVAVGGAYEQYSPFTWVKVGTPNLWARRRKKRVPKFGDMGYILREYKARLCELGDRKSELVDMLPGEDDVDYDYVDLDDAADIEGSDQSSWNDLALGAKEDQAQLHNKIEQVDEEILAVQNDIDGIEAEMRFKVRQMFPKPLGKTPRRVIRKRTEAVPRASRW